MAVSSPSDAPRRLAVSVASGDALDIRQFQVVERMNELFEIAIEAICENPDIDFEAVVGQPMSFTARKGVDGLDVRTWTGICSHIEQVGAEERGLSTYKLVLVPVLWLLTQRRNHRMFQLQSEVDIARKLLGEWSIATEESLSGTYKKRKYRVQYGESDFTFLCRMLEDAGISFYFKTEGGETKLVLHDTPQLNARRELPIAFRDHPTEANREHVTAVRIGRTIRPGKYTVRDHDYRRSPTYDLRSSAKAAGGVEEALEQFEYSPGAFLYESDSGDATPAADDRGRYRTDEKEASALALRRLDAKRGPARTVTFETNTIDLGPGTTLSFLDHPKSELAPGKGLLVTSVSLRGEPNGKWPCACEAVSAEVAYRPALATPKPTTNGVESATVVGPSGEEIHTDEFGRVRVHFHWDRESKMNETSSCWIHTSQPWGGSGFGGTNLPRVGQEVLIDFIGGDPDRPILIGRVYTNLQKTPYKLPENKTQSGMQSRSSPGGGGDNYNELMFEDRKGQELVRIQAEKDLTKLVKHDEDSTVGRNRSRLVKGNEDITIGKNRSKNVVLNDREVVGQNRTISVGINRSSSIGAIDATVAGTSILHMVSPPGEGGGAGTSHLIQDDKIVLQTPGGSSITLEGASITLQADNIFLNASNKATVSGKSATDVNSSGGPVTIKGGPMVLINPSGSLFSGRVTDLAPDQIVRGAATVLVGGPVFPFDVCRLPNGDIKVGNAMTIKGDAEFQGKVMANLGKISTTPSGMTVLNTINNSGRTMDVIPYSGPNSFCGPNPTWADWAAQSPAGQQVYDGAGKPVIGPDGNPLKGTGTGANTTLQLNPDLTLHNSLDPEHPLPNDAIMFHEMTHGTHQMTGTSDASPSPGWDTNEEKVTISTGSPSEADYGREIGYPWHRTDHDSTFAPN